MPSPRHRQIAAAGAVIAAGVIMCDQEFRRVHFERPPDDRTQVDRYRAFIAMKNCTLEQYSIRPDIVDRKHFLGRIHEPVSQMIDGVPGGEYPLFCFSLAPAAKGRTSYILGVN